MPLPYGRLSARLEPVDYPMTEGARISRDRTTRRAAAGEASQDRLVAGLLLTPGDGPQRLLLREARIGRVHPGAIYACLPDHETP